MTTSTSVTPTQKAMAYIKETGKIPVEQIELVSVENCTTWAGEQAIRGTFRDTHSGNEWFFAFLDKST